MEVAGYVHLARQVGLLDEMGGVANNLANMSTQGYRAERMIYSEYVSDRGPGEASVSTARGNVRSTDLVQGAAMATGGSLDLAIEGEGFFRLAGPDGDMLTRSGVFTVTAEGGIAAFDGAALLDAGGAPLAVPPGARSIEVAPDGTIAADGQPIGQIGLWTAAAPEALKRRDGVRFALPDDAVPAEGGIRQGFLERSNVDPVREIARMIEVQRAYELGQSLIDREDQRIRDTIRDTSK